MADGSLKFDTKIDISGFEKGANTLKGIMNRAVQAIKTAGNQAAGAFTGAETGIRALVSEIDRYRDGLYYLEKQGYYFGDREYDEAYAHLARLESQLNQYKKSLAGLDKEQKKAATSSKKLNQSLKQTKATTVPLAKSIIRLSTMFKLMVIRMAMRATLNAIREGFQNLAQYSAQANRDMSALATSTQTLKNSFATAFAPVLTAITPALQTLINTLSEAITTLGQFFAALLTGAKTFTKAKDAQIDYAKSIAKTAKEANKALSPIDKLNVVTDAQTGGYEAPGPQQMFEEIKIDEGLLNKVERFKDLLQPAIDAFDRLKEAAAPFAENVGAGLRWMYDNVLVPLGSWTITDFIPNFLDMLGASIGSLNNVLEVFKPYGLWLWENFLQPIAQWTGGLIIDALTLITNGLNNLSSWLTENKDTISETMIGISEPMLGFKEVVNNVFGDIKNLVKPFIDYLTNSFIPMLQQAIETAKTIITGLRDTFTTVFSDIWNLAVYPLIENFVGTFLPLATDIVTQTLDLLKVLFEEVKKIFDMIWQDAIAPAIELATKIWTDFIDILKEFWDKWGKPIFEGIKEAVKNTGDLFRTIWETTLKPIWDTFMEVLDKLWTDHLKPLLANFMDFVGELVSGALEIYNKFISPIVKWFVEKFGPPISKVISGLIKFIGDFLGEIIDVVSNIIDALKGVVQFVTGVFTGDWKKAWEGIKSIFKGIWDALVGIVKTPINLIIDAINGLLSGVISGLNALIKALNKISFDVPDWVPVIGGKTFGFNIKELSTPKIPRLATGTVVPANYGEFLAILGDNKREAEVVSPLSTMKQAFKEAIAEIGGTGAGTINLNVYLSGKQIHSEVVRVDQEYRAQTGKSAFAY